MVNTVALSLFDFIPPLFFALGAYYLVMLFRHERPGNATTLMIAGTSLVFAGGFLKALSKTLFYLANFQLIIGNVDILSEQQFFLLAPGFVLMLIALVMLVRAGSRATAIAAAAVPAGKLPFMAKMPFMMIMSLAAFGVQGLLAFLAFKRKQYIAAVGFIIAFAVLVWMAGMASGPQTPSREWLEETMNAVGQMGFMLGCYAMAKKSLKV